MKVKTYVVVVFDNEALEAGPLVQLSSTSREWFIVKYHKAIYEDFVARSRYLRQG